MQSAPRDPSLELRPRHLRRRHRRRRRAAAAAGAGDPQRRRGGGAGRPVGLDFIGVGEHHRDDFAVSAPEVVLAAIAGQTTRIRLGSAVTVLSSDDPVRVFERFSTLDAVSNGRAEVILGRGSFTESFPLFGFDLAQYEELFEEKLDLFAELLRSEPVTWSGTHAGAARRDQTVYPPTESGRCATWVGVGGSPESVVRAARYGLPLMLAIIGGEPPRFAPYVDLYHRALDAVRPARRSRSACTRPATSPTPTSRRARSSGRTTRRCMTRIGARARLAADRPRAQFEREAGPDGALYVGSPETVARKIAETVPALGLSRFDLKYSTGTLPHEKLHDAASSSTDAGRAARARAAGRGGRAGQRLASTQPSRDEQISGPRRAIAAPVDAGGAGDGRRPFGGVRRRWRPGDISARGRRRGAHRHRRRTGRHRRHHHLRRRRTAGPAAGDGVRPQVHTAAGRGVRATGRRRRQRHPERVRLREGRPRHPDLRGPDGDGDARPEGLPVPFRTSSAYRSARPSRWPTAMPRCTTSTRCRRPTANSTSASRPMCRRWTACSPRPRSACRTSATSTAG